MNEGVCVQRERERERRFWTSHTIAWVGDHNVGMRQ